MPSSNGHEKFVDSLIANKAVVRNAMEVLEVLYTATDTREEGRLLFTDLSYEEGILAFFKWLTDPNAPNPVER